MRAVWHATNRLLGGTRRLLGVSLGLSLVQSALLIPIALVVRHAFNVDIPAGNARAIFLAGAIVTVLYLASTALALLTRYVALRATKASIVSLRVALLEKLYSLPRSYFDRSDLGRLHGTLVQDTERLDQMGYSLISYVFPCTIISIALVAVLFFINVELTLVMLAVFPIFVVLSFVLSQVVRRRARAWYRQFDAYTAETLIGLRAMTLTKLQAADRQEIERQRGRYAALGEGSLALNWWQGAYTQLNSAVGALAGVVVLVVGGIEVARGSIVIGDLVSFFSAVGLLRGQTAFVLAGLPQVIAGLESLPRLEAILDADAVEPYSGTRPTTCGAPSS